MHKSKRGGVVNNELKTYEQAETDYMNGFKYKEIAEKYNVLISTVKSWKTRYNWNRKGQKSTRTKMEKVRIQNTTSFDEVEQVVENDNLTDEQRLFCIYYVRCFNATKPVNLDKSNVSEINRGHINISTYKVITAENNIYVSNNIRLKPKELHTIDLSISESLKKLKISDVDNLPRVVIINSSEMQTGALASYNAVKNVLYIDRTIGSRLKLLELQKDAACPKNVLSTYVHEYIHWMDAQSYRIGYGEIIDSSEYLYWIRHKSKKKIDKLINKGYNINRISGYASDNFEEGKYDETYTEYRVKKLLGEWFKWDYQKHQKWKRYGMK